MTEADVGVVPIAHQGDAETVRGRIDDLGSSAIVAFDGDTHIGQLQFRRYRRGTRSPSGVWDPLWWMDFRDGTPDLPQDTLAVCCIHVGQRDETDARVADDQGRGIASALLDTFLGWADERGVPAVVAKAVPPVRSVMHFLGGLPAPPYERRGFAVVASRRDPDLADTIRRHDISGGNTPDAATVSCCVRALSRPRPSSSS